MAITNAQQYQQLVNKPADGKRPGYRGDAAARSTGAAQSGRADPGSRGDPGEGRASRDSGVSRDTGGYAPSAFTGGDSASTGRYDEVSPQALQRAQQFIESQTKPQPKFLDQIINFINPFLRFRSTRLAEAKVADIQDTIHQGQIAPILKNAK